MKKKVKKEDLIRIEDDMIDEKEEKENKITKQEKKEERKETTKDIIQEEIEKKKESKKKEYEKIKLETLKREKEEETKDITQKKEIDTEKGKLNLFFLIIALLVIIIYGIFVSLKFDFSNLNIEELIRSLSFPIISLFTIFILFKMNTKSMTPYILFLTLLFIGYSLFSISYAKEINEIYVTDFITKDVVEVIEWAEKYNIELIELHEYSDTIPKNHVILQEYGITTLVNDIKTFTITISDGPNYNKEITLPNLTGFTYNEVMKYIKENFLNNVEIEFIESDKEKDTVIEQIGSGTMKRNDKVKFVFSRGEEIEEVPVKDLKNMNLFEATAYLKRYGIEYEIEYTYDSKIEKNYIISQDIVDKIVDDKLKLVVSLGKEIIIPNLKEMNTNEITKWAMENNLKIKYIEEYNKDLELGSIINFTPEVGEKVDEENVITITISKGSMVMPEITSLSDFKLWANNNHINYEEVYEFSNTYKNGEIIKTFPTSNTKITENDTIVITISKGKSVTIPNLVGLSKTNIQTKCKSLNLSCTFTYGSYTESTKRDISLKQSKKSGMTVSEGTNVLITLSSGIYEKVNVPSFVGKTKNQIISSCTSLGMKCNFKYNTTYSNQTRDTAISQDKTGSVIKGSTINITLSIGPAKTYTVIIDGSLLTLGNPEQTKKTLKTKLENACPGVNFQFSFKAVNSGIGYLNPNSQVKVGSNTFVQGKTYRVIINSNN